MIRKDKEIKPVTYGDIAKNLNEGIEHIDPTRLAGLQQLQRVRAIKGTSLQREQARLTQKLGAKHPRVAALAAKADANRELVRDVALGVTLAQTPPVQADPKAWTLHGHVHKKDRSGIPNLTVALYDGEGEWRREFGYACTDRNGYFKMCHEHPRPTAAEVEQEREGRTPESDEKVYIHLIDSKGAHLYADKRPLSPALGHVDYREIILGDDEIVCPPPEEAVKRGEDKPTRYLGNSGTHELHDVSKTTRRCQIDGIRPDHRVYFKTQKEAVAAGYDYCAYCFGKEKSKR